MSEHQIIIIGAGVSGLAAAKKLTEKGLKDVILIEVYQNKIIL